MKNDFSFADKIDTVTMGENRQLMLYGTIDNGEAHFLSKLLRYLLTVDSKKPITILVNSPGGFVQEGLAIYDNIVAAAQSVPVIGVVDGACMSMALVILQAMSKRYAFPNSRFLLHELQTLQSGSMSHLRDEMIEAEMTQKRLDEILAARTKQDIGKLRKLMERKDFYMGAQKALEFNFIDGIITSHGQLKLLTKKVV